MAYTLTPFGTETPAVQGPGFGDLQGGITLAGGVCAALFHRERTIGKKSVILLDEGEHLEQRKLMLPAFHGEKMQRLSGTMAEVAEREIDSWPEASRSPSIPVSKRSRSR